MVRRIFLLAAGLALVGCGDDLLSLDGAVVKDLSVAPDVGCVGGCIDDRDCFGAHCDRRSTVCGLCVACLLDEHCPIGQLCNLQTETCRAGCGGGRGCAPDGGVCEVDAGMCIGCISDGDCGDPMWPRCDAQRAECVACLPQNDNCGHGLYCVGVAGGFACVSGCKGDADCAQNMRCLAQGNACVGCLSDTDCGAGTLCQANQCVSGCSISHVCPMGETCCQNQGKSACGNFAGDVNNCGGCGIVCPANWNCCGACSDPTNDFNHCGGCNIACAVAHGQPGCVFSKCVIAVCDAGWSDCNQSIADGCETHTDIDLNNCGGCGQICALNNAFSSCAGGVCTVGACYQNFADCDGNAKNGCEAALRQDPNNCGGCGVVCGQGMKCVGGICQ